MEGPGAETERLLLAMGCSKTLFFFGCWMKDCFLGFSFWGCSSSSSSSSGISESASSEARELTLSMLESRFFSEWPPNSARWSKLVLVYTLMV